MKRKKVILYNPKAVFFDLPLALLTVGSMLDAAHYEVVIIDGRIAKDGLQKVLEVVDDALCLGITSLTGKPLRDALDVSRAAKARRPNLPVIWGGWHASLFPRQTLEDEPCIDITVQAQGEITFRELVACIDSGSDLSAVQGICYRTAGGDIVQNASRPLTDMNLLPRVNYELIDCEPYFKAKKRRQFDYISSAGCRFRCTFCADPFVFGRKWTAISPERMGEELEYWYKRYQFTDINFQDETFFTKRRRVIEIAKEVTKRRINSSWAATMRADQGARMTEADFDLCKQAGLRRVLVGVESGSQEMMDWMMKDIKIEQVFETARRCAQRDIHVIFPFIVGFPGEPEESVLETLKVARQLNAMHPGFTTPIFYFKPYPGSKITQDVVAQGYQLPKTIEQWADFDYIGSSGPWVSDEKYGLIENFKFYNKLAGKKQNWLIAPLQWLAGQRCDRHFFSLPFERLLAELLLPRQQLS